MENTIADQVLPEDFTEYTINFMPASRDVDHAVLYLTITVSCTSNIPLSTVAGFPTTTPTADCNASHS
ncbi:hypothetical protein ABXV24_26510, partial [Vibrio owensii]|uniref:hypothetical protein n=1 Tax=Vibrio owensii TaxID=696485 RepID=UPI003392E461